MGEETILCTNPETGPIRRMGWGIDGGVMCTAGPLNVPMPMGAVFSQWASLLGVAQREPETERICSHSPRPFWGRDPMRATGFHLCIFKLLRLKQGIFQCSPNPVNCDPHPRSPLLKLRALRSRPELNLPRKDALLHSRCSP